MNLTPTELLVSHGSMPLLSRCRHLGTPLQRSKLVVIQTVRGLELGEVLGEVSIAAAGVTTAELIRPANDKDLADSQRYSDLARTMLDQVHDHVDRHALPILPLEMEVLLDGRRAVLHLIKWDTPTLTPLKEQIESTFGMSMLFLDRSKPGEEVHSCGSCGSGGCGEGGCGSGGGCGTSSCSSGAVKSPAEMTAYFAQLREQMHASQRVALASF